VLLTGEVSRRRRRRVVGRFSNSMSSPDIGSDNSSAIISQQQQQQEQQQQQQQNQETSEPSLQSAAFPLADSTSTLTSTSIQSGLNVDQHQQHLETEPTADLIQPVGPSVAAAEVPSETATGSAAPIVPAVSVEMVDNPTTHDDAEHRNDFGGASSRSSGAHLGLGLSTTSNTGHHHRPSVPPTPPSPNPNRNPMPTFQDRRRSSINPADIETLVREMEANAQSAALGIRNARPTSSPLPRVRFPLHALSPIAEPGGSTPPVVPLVPPLGILAPSTSSTLAGPTGSRATQPALLSPEPEPEPEQGSERIAGPHSPPLQ